MEYYIKIELNNSFPLLEALTTEMAEIGFEAFAENETTTDAFIQEGLFKRELLSELLNKYGLSKTDIIETRMEPHNWNAAWETNFEPIIIHNKVIIKAPFHQVSETYPYELIIQPKNTFGTGHHETTQLMIGLMLETEFENKSVFDYGCGTGVLGIMASKMGAAHVAGIDIDSWSADNIEENTTLNNVSTFRFMQGDLSVMSNETFDIILANINRNILLTSFATLFQLCNKQGRLLISGFYESDVRSLKEEAAKHGFEYVKHQTLNTWAAICLIKETARL